MSNIRKYCASFILDMRGCNETVGFVMDKLSKVITELDGKISEINNLGQKNFERVANKKFSNGIYVQVAFEGPTTVAAGIKSKLSLDKTINRILIETVR